MALAGIALAKPLAGGHMLGNPVALSDGAVYAATVACMRHEGKPEAGHDIAWSMLAAAVPLSPAAILAGPGAVAATIAYPALGIAVPVVLWAAGLGVVAIGLACFGISIVPKSLDASVYALVDIIARRSSPRRWAT